ncbi:MAG: flagellar hook capping FlgD N-terminal domain-containing protein [Thermodesulfobacteriota bacterium]|nr:flagellar hook capping FlgD N-terminal domain-containing protein [Thermodesulfobacteriota bacterium]
MSVITENQIMQNLLPQTGATDAVERVNSSKGMDRDAFLKLLLTQLQNQDPLNPMEGTEFTSQLAQFTSLEQLYNLNDSFATVSSTIQASNDFQAISLVGKTIKALGTAMYVSEGDPTNGIFQINEPTVSTVVNIYDDIGKKIRVLDLGALPAGNHNIDWDGLDANGTQVADGKYDFEILALDAENQAIEVSSRVEGKITGVTFETGAPVLLMNGLAISLADIYEITDTAPADDEEEG